MVSRVSYWKFSRFILWGSLALNLMFVGALGGWILKGSYRAKAPMHPGFVYTRALPSDVRRAMWRDLRADHQVDVLRQDTGYREVIGLLRGTPFEAERFREALHSQFEHKGQRERYGQEALIAEVLRMSDEERANYAERLETMIVKRKHSRQ